MTDAYAYWYAKLAGEDPDPPTDRTQPPAGRWRTQGGQPVAIWPDAKQPGLMQGRIGIGEKRRKLSERELASMGEMGSFGVAITQAVYEDVAVRGEPWPDMDPVLHEQLKQAAQPGSGHNQPPTDPYDVLAEQIGAATKGTNDYEVIDSDEQAARAQSLRVRLNELSRGADDERERLKRPHLDAGQKIDARWMPLVRLAKDAAAYLATKMSAWETLKVRRGREAQEAQRRQEEEAQQRDITLPPTEAPPPPADAPGRIRGAYGRAAAVTTVKVVVVEDWPAAAAALSFDPGVQAAVRKAAQRAVDLGQEVAGVTYTEQRKVK
jgi:hypothetical protein